MVSAQQVTYETLDEGRIEQHPPLVRGLRPEQGGAGPPLMVAADELGPSWVQVDHRAGMLESIFGADGLRGVV